MKTMTACALGVLSFCALISTPVAVASSGLFSDCHFYLRKPFHPITKARIIQKIEETKVAPFYGELEDYYETGMEHVAWIAYAKDDFEQKKKDLGATWTKLDQLTYPISLEELESREALKTLFTVGRESFYSDIEDGDWILLLDEEGKIVADTVVKYAIVQFRSRFNDEPIFQPMPENVDIDLWLQAAEKKFKIVLFKK